MLSGLPSLTKHIILEFIYGERPLDFNWEYYWAWREKNLYVMSDLEDIYYPDCYLAASIHTKYYINSNITYYRVLVYSIDNNNGNIYNKHRDKSKPAVNTYTFADVCYKNEFVNSLSIWCYRTNKYTSTIGTVANV